jgi:hypothetical protein
VTLATDEIERLESRSFAKRYFVNELGREITAGVEIGAQPDGYCRLYLYGPDSGIDSYTTRAELAKIYEVLREIFHEDSLLSTLSAHKALIGSLFDAIQHGDLEHRAWLKEAIAAHFNGDPVPAPRGSSRKEAEIARLKALIEKTEATAEQIATFTRTYFEPWGSWKTAWWEGEVSDAAAFSAGNALKHVANIADWCAPR